MRKSRLCMLIALCLCAVAHYTLTRLFPSDTEDTIVEDVGTTWAILVAGAYGWGDYASQASLCFAYQLLKAGGIDDEKIIVFMKDDIARNRKNPQPGFIKHQDYPYNVYEGVPKDYTDKYWTIANLKGVLYGDRTRVKGGSGKVLNSNSNDTIFFFFVGHGERGILKFGDETLNVDELADIFKELHKLHKYRSMVAYIEACYSGSMFLNRDALYKSMNIYVMTSTNDTELSRRTREDITLQVPIGSYFCVAWIHDR